MCVPFRVRTLKNKQHTVLIDHRNLSALLHIFFSLPLLFSRTDWISCGTPRTIVRKFRKNPIWTENLLRKEVIQPHLPIRLPCYDFTPIINPTFDCCLLAVSSQASGVIDSHGVTGGVYKARERIHRDILIRDY